MYATEWHELVAHGAVASAGGRGEDAAAVLVIGNADLGESSSGASMVIRMECAGVRPT